MTTNHIDQLTQWWDEAEHAPFREGDVLIARFDDRPMPYEVYPAGCDSDSPADHIRILDRAPKPKPAWHDAVAVMAALDVNSYDEWSDGAWTARREIWVRDGEAWESVAEGITVPPERLIGPTPLIEAKVTKEARDRLWKTICDLDWDGDAQRSECKDEIDALLHAALGLETA